MCYFLVSDTRKHWFDSCWRKTSFEFQIIPFLSVQWSLIHGRIFLWAVLFHSCQEPSQWCICHRAASFVENTQFAAGASFIKTFFDLYLNSVLRSFHYVPFIKALKKKPVLSRFSNQLKPTAPASHDAAQMRFSHESPKSNFLLDKITAMVEQKTQLWLMLKRNCLTVNSSHL